jgi:arabinose-5-phosphate isomerase
MENITKYINREINGLLYSLNTIKDNKVTKTKIDILETEIEVASRNGGKIIFTGVGKNVFACQKLAASYSSIGIPSFFLDAVHAVHGDLGVISKNDIIIAMSKSGNTAELVNMLSHLKSNKDRFPSDVYGIDCGLPDNKFDDLCDMVIHLDVPNEIDEMNLVPTISAVMLQIVGDIIGISVAESMGLNKEKYGINHPGGTIGQITNK